MNLLPPATKEELVQEKKFKMILILGILFLFFLISFSLILYSIKFFLAGETATAKIIFEQKEKEFKNSPIQVLQGEITMANEKISQLGSFYQGQPKIREILEKISNTFPPKTYLTNLSLTSQAKVLSFNLGGFSPSREILLEFKKNLEKEKIFSEIIFPSSNWLEPVNINFSVSFKVKW